MLLLRASPKPSQLQWAPRHRQKLIGLQGHLLSHSDRAGVSKPGGFWAYFLTFFAGDGPLEWVRPLPKAPERSWHASGPSFSPNR